MRTSKFFTHLAQSALMLAALTFNGGANAQALSLAKSWNFLGNSNTASIDVASTFSVWRTVCLYCVQGVS